MNRNFVDKVIFALSHSVWTGIGSIAAIFALIVAFIALPPFWREDSAPPPLPTATFTLTLPPSATMTDTPTNTPQPTATDSPTTTHTSEPTSTDLPIFTDAPTNTPSTPSPVPNLSISPTNTVIVSAYPCNAEIVFTTGALLNQVRVSPIMNAPLTEPVRQGTSVIISQELKAENLTWYHIEYDNGAKSGWILDNHINVSAECP